MVWSCKEFNVFPIKQVRALTSRYQRKQRDQNHHICWTMAGRVSPGPKQGKTTDTQQTRLHWRTEFLLCAAAAALRLNWTHQQTVKAATKQESMWNQIPQQMWHRQNKTTETGPQSDPCPVTPPEMKTQPWQVHRSTGKRGSTVTPTSTVTGKANTPEVPPLKASASLTWWRKGPTRTKKRRTMRPETRRNQTITSWQSSSRSLVGYVGPQQVQCWSWEAIKCYECQFCVCVCVRYPQRDAAWQHHRVLQPRLCSSGGRSQQGG